MVLVLYLSIWNENFMQPGKNACKYCNTNNASREFLNFTKIEHFQEMSFLLKKVKRHSFVSEIVSNECVEFREEILKIGRKKRGCENEDADLLHEAKSSFARF